MTAGPSGRCSEGGSDAATGLATAKETAKPGRTFQFKVSATATSRSWSSSEPRGAGWRWLASPLVALVTFAQGNFQSAKACLTDVNVIGLNLRNVPNWLDSTWVRDWLNGRLANRACFDITGLVQLYLQRGGKL